MRNKSNLWTAGVILIALIGMALYFTLFQYKPVTRDKEIQQQAITENNESNQQNQVDLDESPKGIEQGEPLAEHDSLPLYTGDIETYEKKKTSVVKTRAGYTVEEKLNLIAEELSKTQFEGLPIEVKAIEKIEGKKIAVINLEEKEAEKNQDKKWMRFLNGGSAGAQITLIALKESFLQKDLKKEWIDGIKIIYEGKDIVEMDHFPGTEIIYRVDQ